ncbi:MAG: cytochrome b/b6 domain-containing protein [Chloroflexi bacterium]|nr:cytochrome b/b6 domain-containing protein [Chloroflexota bacterium]MBI2979921.1 cytochrome b/b6 domain-containing protein [Chloroflexota bacterium]
MVTGIETLSAAKELEEKITRFDIHQIIQHALLMVSFILLVVTGLPLKFHDFAISQWWTAAWGGIEATRFTHRFAAWVMVSVSVYHLLYLWYTINILKRPFPIKMVPGLQDFIKLAQELGYFMGLRKEMPRYDRFNWKEKFDYWAIFWGIPVMAGSGFIMMYPVLVTRFLPGWVVPTALIAHSDEAMLALIWIFMVHIFFNHFTPGVFPFNTSIFTGKVAGERYRREHPLEYERLLGISEQKEETDDESKSDAERNNETDSPDF